VTWNRYAKRTDTTQAGIIYDLQSAGWKVWVIGWPCDLLCWKSGRGFHLLECKTPQGKQGKAKVRKDQAEQNAFVELTGVARVTNGQEALLAVGEKITL
jgi:hypothetical protein